MQVVLRLISYLGEYRRRAALAVLCLVGTSLLGLVSPRLVQSVIDRAMTIGSPSVLGLYAMGVLGVALASGLFSFGQRYMLAWVVQGAIFSLRNELFGHIMGLPFSFHDRSRQGQLISRLTGDMDQIAMFLGFGLSSLVSMALTLFGSAGLLFAIDWRLGLLGTLLIPPIALTAISGSSQLGPRFYEIRQQYGRITGQIQEAYAGVRVIKAFAREEHEISKLDEELEAFRTRWMGIVRVFSLFFPSMGFMTNLGVVLVLGLGGVSVINGSMTVGELVAAQGYLMMLTGPIRMIGWMIVMGRRALASSQRLFEILDTENEIQAKPDALELPPVEGRVELERVTFGYEADANVLEDVSFTAEPGQTIALVGATGSGKTSIINLIPRFYDVVGGRVLVDGHDVRDVTLHSLRSQIGSISQEAVLFAGTIAENIAFGRPEASESEIESAAKAAQAHGFIVEFVEGYDTVVGERGVTLSGGQRQRLTIARALLMEAPILIMDDSTSSVDVETEYLIQRALNQAMSGRTSFVIAHRLSTVKNADRILVLEAGRVVEDGRHADLMQGDGYYRRIYETQFADQEGED